MVFQLFSYPPGSSRRDVSILLSCTSELTEELRDLFQNCIMLIYWFLQPVAMEFGKCLDNDALRAVAGTVVRNCFFITFCIRHSQTKCVLATGVCVCVCECPIPTLWHAP